MLILITTLDDIFTVKYLSESNYDYLRFYIDGVQQEQWSGSVAWGQVSYPVSEGAHFQMDLLQRWFGQYRVRLCMD
ncbi:MAG: hypothetical protein R2764_02845 [Bacteroidales bacterium]